MNWRADNEWDAVLELRRETERLSELVATLCELVGFDRYKTIRSRQDELLEKRLLTDSEMVELAEIEMEVAKWPVGKTMEERWNNERLRQIVEGLKLSGRDMAATPGEM